jgi:lipopolysaccharide/colanic/teichoic acid biosynthesis glycosyltransferase
MNMHAIRVAYADATQLSFARELVAIGHDRRNTAARRLADIVVGLALLVFTLPLMVLTAVLIRLDSAGPVLYRQVCVGPHGRSFTTLKFRSMHADADVPGPVWAAQREPRFTRIGRFLWLTRIDELPQLLNVLRGEMSFIDPRPERPFYVERLEPALPSDLLVLAATGRDALLQRGAH